MEKEIIINEHKIIVSDPPTLWERLRFGVCVLILRLPFSTINATVCCVEVMRKMTLKRRSLLSVAVREMHKSPRLAFNCILYFLSLPDNYLETNELIYGKFGSWPGSYTIRERINQCVEAISMCFTFKTMGGGLSASQIKQMQEDLPVSNPSSTVKKLNRL